MSHAGRPDWRARLLAEREAVQVRLAALRADFTGIVESSRNANADDEHDPEGATIAFERSQVAALVTQAQERLAEVETALQLLEQGRYGTCERCGEAIPGDRLAVRPTARRCVPCATRGA